MTASTTHSAVRSKRRQTAKEPSSQAGSSKAAGSNAAGTNDQWGKSGGRWWMYIVITGLVIALAILVAGSGLFHRAPEGHVSPTLSALPAAYDSQRSFSYLKQLCDIGPRPSGSAGMKRQQDLLDRHFRQQGAQVTFQTFEIRHPQDGSNVPMANLIATWNADASKRFLICAHYDTRPFPDQDRHNPQGVFIGANDGASGTAGLMELANQMHDLPADVGVDLVAFDGEEFIFQQGRDKYFLGSNFFAEKYKAAPPPIRYTAGVLLDMIGDRELKIYYETNSLRYAPKVAREIWSVARRLRVRAFVPKKKHEIQDDHLPLNQIANIPTIDIIDFDYPREGFGAPSYWHTEMDVPENCHGQSIAAVVWVVHQWLKQQ